MLDFGASNVLSPKKQQSHTSAEGDDNDQDAMFVEDEEGKEDHEHEEEDKEDEHEEEGEEDDNGIEEIENGVSQEFGSKESVVKSPPHKKILILGIFLHLTFKIFISWWFIF
jgi:hypothetical protein